MFLSADEIRSLIDNMDMIEGHTEEQSSYIEGSTFDITVKRVLVSNVVRPPFLGARERELPSLNDVPLSEDGCFHLNPGYYMLQSVESVKLPGWIGAAVFPRTTLFNCETLLGWSRVAPGYNGNMRCGLFVFSPLGLILEKYARFASLGFYRIGAGRTDCYVGVWSGDKVTTNGRERAW